MSKYKHAGDIRHEMVGQYCRSSPSVHTKSLSCYNRSPNVREGLNVLAIANALGQVTLHSLAADASVVSLFAC